MRVDYDGAVITIVLSKRNLLTLLNKVEDEESAKTLVKNEGHIKLVVRVEDDFTHYHNRPEGGPGKVHPKHDPSLTREMEANE